MVAFRSCTRLRTSTQLVQPRWRCCIYDQVNNGHFVDLEVLGENASDFLPSASHTIAASTARTVVSDVRWQTQLHKSRIKLHLLNNSTYKLGVVVSKALSS